MSIFNFFKKKIDTVNIKGFNDVLKVANFFIDEKKWDKAHDLIQKAHLMEKTNSDNLITGLDTSNEKDYTTQKPQILKKYNARLDKIKDLEIHL
jgi:hypothetical protein